MLRCRLPTLYGSGMDEPSTRTPPASATSATIGAFPALLVTRADNPEDPGRVELATLTMDDLPAGEVVVKVAWSSVNYKDGMVTTAGNRVARISPLVPGVDLVGTVVATTSPDVACGAEVIVHAHDLGVAHHGGFAHYARVPADWVVPLPAGLSARDAAALGTAGFTAALSLRELEQSGLTPDAGEVLVTGASGGLGGMAVALLAHRGYEVTASTGRMEEESYLRALGARRVIHRDEVIDTGPRTLGPERWAGAIDCVGGSTLAAILRTLNYGAAVAASGLTGGSTFETTVYPFIVRAVRLIGIDAVETPAALRADVWNELGASFPTATLGLLTADEVELDALPGTLQAILAGQIRGRTMVRLQP